MCEILGCVCACMYTCVHVRACARVCTHVQVCDIHLHLHILPNHQNSVDGQERTN